MSYKNNIENYVSALFSTELKFCTFSYYWLVGEFPKSIIMPSVNFLANPDMEHNVINKS